MSRQEHGEQHGHVEHNGHAEKNIINPSIAAGGLGEEQQRRIPLQPQPQPQPQPQRQCSSSTSSNPSQAPPRRVDHTYRDYSNFPLSELPIGKKAPTNFPSKLHQILSNPEYAHIISWMPHGRAWRIHNKDLLVREVVPKYFVQSKYESFTRQLNGWGFKRLHQSGNDFNAYYHECFLSGLPHLTILMRRVQPNQGKLLPYVEGEPNFYEIDKQFPLPTQMTMIPSHMTGTGYGYGAPPEPSTGHHYHSPSQYPSYPGNYPPPPPYYDGPQGAPHAAASYAPPSGYPPYPYYPSHYSQKPPHEHHPYYPYPPGPQYGAPHQYDNHPLVDSDYGKGEEMPSFPTPPGPEYGAVAVGLDGNCD